MRSGSSRGERAPPVYLSSTRALRAGSPADRPPGSSASGASRRPRQRSRTAPPRTRSTTTTSTTARACTACASYCRRCSQRRRTPARWTAKPSCWALSWAPSSMPGSASPATTASPPAGIRRRFSARWRPRSPSGRILNLRPEALRNALGIAFHQAGGSVQSAYDGVISKRLGPGFAARDAVVSAFLAADGLTGTRDPFDRPGRVLRAARARRRAARAPHRRPRPQLAHRGVQPEAVSRLPLQPRCY